PHGSTSHPRFLSSFCWSETIHSNLKLALFRVSRLHLPPYQLQVKMIIIRPQILISASFISLALLLVSATPIPSPDLVSGAASNVLVTRNSDTISQPRKPWATQPLPRPYSVLSAEDTPIGRIQTKMAEIRKTYEEDIPMKNPSTEEHLVRKINEFAVLIQGIPENVAAFPITRPMVCRDIAQIKLDVAKWDELKDKGPALTAIEACWKAAITIFPVMETDVVPKHVLKLLSNLIKANSAEPEQFEELKGLNDHLLALSLDQQREIHKQLQDGYSVVQAKIKDWEEEWNVRAQEEMKRWKWLNNLVDAKVENKVKNS
ncbi:hypothetical protein H0H93_010429, partial [Arthromyces matolae]